MTTPLVLRIVASSFNIANKSGEIIRNILKGGNLGIVDKATGLCNQVSLHVQYAFRNIWKTTDIILRNKFVKNNAINATATAPMCSHLVESSIPHSECIPYTADTESLDKMD